LQIVGISSAEARAAPHVRAWLLSLKNWATSNRNESESLDGEPPSALSDMTLISPRHCHRPMLTTETVAALPRTSTR